jgi:hypothetical protein
MKTTNQDAMLPMQFTETLPKYLAFDLEITKVVPDGATDFMRFRPLGMARQRQPGQNRQSDAG